MAKNTDGNEENMTTPSEDEQGHCDPSQPPTQVFIRPCTQDIDDNRPESKKKKKKSRGDRRAQNKRRRLRRQQRKMNANQNPIESHVVYLPNDPNEQQIQVG